MRARVSLMRESADEFDELHEIEIGDLVDVDLGHEAFSGCRVIDDVDDVNAAAGDADGSDFSGPGYIVELPTGDELIVAAAQVVPGSKVKYFFNESAAPLLTVIRDDMTRDQAITFMYHFLWPEAFDDAPRAYVKKVTANATRYVDSAPGKPQAFGLARERGSTQDPLLLAGKPGAMTHVLDPYIARGWVSIADYERGEEFDEVSSLLGNLIREAMFKPAGAVKPAPRRQSLRSGAGNSAARAPEVRSVPITRDKLAVLSRAEGLMSEPWNSDVDAPEFQRELVRLSPVGSDQAIRAIMRDMYECSNINDDVRYAEETFAGDTAVKLKRLAERHRKRAIAAIKKLLK